MLRQLRIQYPGALYHVMSRGNRRQDIFLDDADRHEFLKTLAEACQKTDWQIHAYCLMRNHYHLVVETPNANLVTGMTWLQSTYTIRLHHRHKLIGHVLSGRDKAQLSPSACTWARPRAPAIASSALGTNRAQTNPLSSTSVYELGTKT